MGGIGVDFSSVLAAELVGGLLALVGLVAIVYALCKGLS